MESADAAWARSAVGSRFPSLPAATGETCGRKACDQGPASNRKIWPPFGSLYSAITSGTGGCAAGAGSSRGHRSPRESRSNPGFRNAPQPAPNCLNAASSGFLARSFSEIEKLRHAVTETRIAIGVIAARLIPCRAGVDADGGVSISLGVCLGRRQDGATENGSPVLCALKVGDETAEV